MVCYLFWATVELARLGWRVRFNFNHPYVRWRMETAFRSPDMVWSWERIKLMYRYGYWVHRMRMFDK